MGKLSKLRFRGGKNDWQKEALKEEEVSALFISPLYPAEKKVSRDKKKE